jgi:MFS transporter, OFA family, oxalate/formate antiporter
VLHASASDGALSGAAEFRRGYPTLLACVLGSALGVAALQIYAIPFFIGPLQSSLGFSRSQLSGLAGCQALGLLIATPLYGRLCDRFGVRRVAPVAVVLFALMVFATSRISTLWELYSCYIGAAILGAGTGYGCYSRPVSAWFDKARGLTLGMNMAGPGLMATILPLVLPGVIGRYGWRSGYAALAALALSALLPVLGMLRDQPPPAVESSPSDLSPGPRTAQATAQGLSLREAARTRQFWSIWIGVFVLSSVVVGFHIHLMGMLTRDGLTSGQAARVTALFGVAVVLGRIGIGALVDRIHAPYVSAGVFGLTGLGVLALAMSGPGLAPVFVFFLGLSAGSEGDMLAYLTSRYFGLKSFTEIFSWLWSSMLIGVAVGPIAVGMLADHFSSFQLALYLGTASCLAVAVLFASLGRFPSERADIRGRPLAFTRLR